MADAPGFTSMPRRNPLGRVLLLLVAASLLLLSAAPALSVVLPRPTPARRLTITGGTIGKVGRHHKLRLVMTAAAPPPKGFVALETLSASLILRGQVLETIVYDIGADTVQIAGREPIKVGDRPAPLGSFFQIFPRHARKIRSTFSVNFTVWMYFLEAVSKDARWRFIAHGSDSAVAISYKVRLAPGFLSWSTFGLAAAAALFIGGFIGNTYTHRRYRAGEPSVWDILERRLKEQRARPPAIRAARGDGGFG
jgi:hypothetical protein